MAPAKNRSGQDRLDFKKKHGRWPRAGELTGARKSTSVPSKTPKNKRGTRARAVAGRARKAILSGVGPNRPILHAAAVAAGGAAAPYAESVVVGGGTAVKVATGYLTGSPGLQDTGVFEAGARLVQALANGPVAPGSGYGRIA